jgi:hypothetical protein
MWCDVLQDFVCIIKFWRNNLLEFVVLFFKEYDQNVPNKIIFGMH